MGYETGRFLDEDLGELHVEASAGRVYVHEARELKSPLRMLPAEARKLVAALELGLSYYEES